MTRADALAEGLALHRAGRLREARGCYERALKANSADPNVFHLLGVLDLAAGALAAGERRIRRALQLHPAFPDAHYNLGRALHRQSRFADAAASYRAALALNPGLAEAQRYLGEALHTLGRPAEAASCFRAAVAVDPKLVAAWLGLGRSCEALSQSQAAIEALEAVLALSPGHGDGAVLRQLQHLRLHVCDWSSHEADAAALRAAARAGVRVAPFQLRAAGADAAEMLAAARTEAAQIVAPPSPALLKRAGRERLRIGYLSADLHAHPVGLLAVDLFERHDRAGFDITAFSHGPDDRTPLRRRLEAAFDRFIDISGDSNAEAARRIAARGIDILVDLGGHSGVSRLGILAARAAPVQVNMLGYLGPMGVPAVDYVIADSFVLPAAMQAFYPERILHLPHGYLPLDMRGRAVAETLPRAAYGLPESGFVFANFSMPYKIVPAVFDVWMRVLLAVPGSVLWLYERNPAICRTLAREAQARGADPARLVFAPKLPQPAYLARFAAADLFLDTLPCSACTTGVDALWAGLPVLTCAGEIFAGRHAGSSLHAAGLPGLVTHSLAEYEALAVRLATEPGMLAGLRARLARREGALFDMDGYVRALEAIYREIALP